MPHPHPAFQAYNESRDREAYAFEGTPTGNAVRLTLNARLRKPDAMARDLPMALALAYAFGPRWPAFYAMRSLRLG